MRQVIGVGAGGHAKVVMEILHFTKNCELVGLLDIKRELWGTCVLGVPVLGDDTLLPQMYDNDVRYLFIGVGTVGDTRPRRRLYEKVRKHGFGIMPAIHPRAVISRSVEIGDGPTIMAGVVINVSATLGNNVIVNTGALIEHDCIVGDHVHIATGARLSGTVQVANGAHIGAGATVLQNVVIGEGAVVGAGAAVIKNVEPWTVVVGVPARVVKRREVGRLTGISESGKGTA